jgi:mannose-6-phosphate isomerase-like protein (cupin superfamily)
MADLKPVHQTHSPAYFFAGVAMKLHLTGRQTGNAFCLLESLMPVDHMTPPHMHREEDEAFLILEGELEIAVGGETITVRTGEAAFAPRGVPHQLRNTSGRPVRAIVVTTPAGFGDFVLAAGTPASDGAPPAPMPEQLAAIAVRFGIQIPA